MKKLFFLTALTASLLAQSSNTLENKLNSNEPKVNKIEQFTDGFSNDGMRAIIIAENEVSKKYYLPEVAYAEENMEILYTQLDKTLSKIFPEFEKSKSFELNRPYDCKNGRYLLIMEDFQKQEIDSYFQDYYSGGTIKPLDERFSVSNMYPMVAQTIHNIGHIYFDMVGTKTQLELAACFQFLDRFIYRKTEEKIIGHPSLLSHYSSIPPGDEVTIEYALTNADEQFAETFVYHILDYNYKNEDKLFQKRLEIVEKSLELFAKD
jgi:uncharacterized membrane protein